MVVQGGELFLMSEVPLYTRMIWVGGGGYRRVLPRLDLILDEAFLIEE